MNARDSQAYGLCRILGLLILLAGCSSPGDEAPAGLSVLRPGSGARITVDCIYGGADGSGDLVVDSFTCGTEYSASYEDSGGFPLAHNSWSGTVPPEDSRFVHGCGEGRLMVSFAGEGGVVRWAVVHDPNQAGEASGAIVTVVLFLPGTCD